jgi:hypothetical protein
VTPRLATDAAAEALDFSPRAAKAAVVPVFARGVSVSASLEGLRE